MKTIYKYDLPIDGGVITITDKVEKFLNVRLQNGVPRIWAIVDTDEKAKNPVNIMAIGTGWEASENLGEYLGTLEDDWGYIWHYFKINLDSYAIGKLNQDAFAALVSALGTVGTSATEVGYSLKAMAERMK